MTISTGAATILLSAVIAATYLAHGLGGGAATVAYTFIWMALLCVAMIVDATLARKRYAAHVETDASETTAKDSQTQAQTAYRIMSHKANQFVSVRIVLYPQVALVIGIIYAVGVAVDVKYLLDHVSHLLIVDMLPMLALMRSMIGIVCMIITGIYIMSRGTRRRQSMY